MKLALILPCVLLLAAGPSFDEAKMDPSKRAAWLTEKLAKVGAIKGFYNMTDEAQAKAGQAALKAEYKEDGREFFFNRELKKVLQPIEVSSIKVVPYYREGIDIGQKAKSGIILIGDVFALESEDEALSVIEDYLAPFVKYAEEGVKIGDREVDMFVPALKNMAYTSLIKSLAQSNQVAAILTGKRKVSDAFRESAVQQYLTTYRMFNADLLKQKKIFDDNNENTLQKEIWDSLEMVKAHLVETLDKAGYVHECTDKATQDHVLKKK